MKIRYFEAKCPLLRKGKAALKESQESGGIATAAKELPLPQGMGAQDTDCCQCAALTGRHILTRQAVSGRQSGKLLAARHRGHSGHHFALDSLALESSGDCSLV
jgi:hypothetical protein